METNVKEWYCEEYESDELGVEINPNLTFADFYEGLKLGKEVYGLLGVIDSIVRERVFDKLADILGVTYDFVFDLWLHPKRCE